MCSAPITIGYMSSTHTFRTVAAAAAVTMAAVSFVGSGVATAAPASGAFCSKDTEGGTNPDTNKVKQIAQTAVDSAQAAGLTMGVSIAGAGNSKPVINVGAADKAMYAASTVKVPIAATIYDKGLAAQHSDDLQAMLGKSDNDAANRLIDAAGGFEPINALLRKAGVADGEYKVSNRLAVDSSQQSSVLSAIGGAKFLLALCNAAAADGGVISKDNATRLLTTMGDVGIKSEPSKARLFQGGFTRLAEKSGWNDDVKDGKSVSHDIGITGGGNHWFIISVTTEGGTGQQSAGDQQIATFAKSAAPVFNAATK